MRMLMLSNSQFDMVISGVSAEINHTNLLLRKKINNTLRIHLENRLESLLAFMEYLKIQKQGD